MDSQKEKLHEFHFVLSKGMKESLEDLIIFEGPVNLSSIIVKIISLLTPVIKREHDWGKERMSQYMHVSPDPTEKREHMHAYLPKNLYRKLKLIHQDLNFFSIAQVVRFFLELFLGYVEEYGDKVLEELGNTFTEWEKITNHDRLTLCQCLRQLWKIVQHLPEGNRMITVYDDHFSPFWRFRL